MINRYIAEVGRHLPEKNRTDIEAEIRSTLEDFLEEHGQQTGQPIDDTHITAALEQLGDPKLLAYKYTPMRRYLIGPDWYDIYVNVLKRILSIALPVVAAVAFFVALADDPMDFIHAVGQALGRVVDAVIGIVLWVTVGFIIVERTNAKPTDLGRAKTQTWTVNQLPELPKKRQISIGETLANIVFIIGFTAWVALPSFRAGIQSNGEFIPFLHPNLWRVWMPLFFVIAGLTVIHEVFKLKIGNWTPALMAANVVLSLVSMAYIVALVMTQEVINPAFLTALGNGIAGAEMREAITWSTDISAAILVGIYGWSMINSILMARRLKQKSEQG